MNAKIGNLLAALLLLASPAVAIIGEDGVQVRRLSKLPIGKAGFELKPLSAKAALRHAEFYKLRKLELVGEDKQTFDLYRQSMEKTYGKAALKREVLYQSPEILEAQKAGPAAGEVREAPDAPVFRQRILLNYFQIDPRILKMLASKNGLVDVIIPQALYDDPVTQDVEIKGSQTIPLETGMTVKKVVDRYLKDLEAAGYWTQLYKISGGTAADLKEMLVADRKWGLVGAVMIGNVPAAWYRMTDDFYGASEFPMDLYYMDLDGTWGDADSNGVFDSHTGSVAPDVWVGRIRGNVPTYGKTEAQIVIQYLSRNHYWRIRDMAKTARLFSWSADKPYYRALAFQDDDWPDEANSRYLNGYLTNERELWNDPDDTSAANYLGRLAAVPGGYYYDHIMAHSSPTSHGFKVSQGGVNVTQLRDNLKRAHYYQLFNCSGAKFTVDDFFGGLYVFGNDYGLGGVGSAKTGAMTGFEVYYANASGKMRAADADLADDWDVTVGTPQPWGVAFLKWFRYVAKGGFSLGERQWHYGMVYLGDPTLYADWTLNKGATKTLAIKAPLELRELPATR